VYTEEYLHKLGLNERQIKAVAYLQKKGKIARSEYVKLTKCSPKTANNDLYEMLNKRLIKQKGGGKYTFLRVSSRVILRVTCV